ncbi:DUF5818 domain-containing protein [Catellatospora coxensis]|uniref:Nucleic acid binding protein n=1 Tax=Catellatospora coxensis TaxID=310354 RepID=A0A8J3KTW7_9ACTN|nr:DUF5818 domain-containing protein [Catellatospora coxensis]GIG06157.1 hypothetical protein Cco03nite_28570 [Catellatospora coxensis]
MTTRTPLTHLLLTGALLGGLLLTACAPSEEPEVGSSMTPQPSASAVPPSTGRPKPSLSGPVVPPPAKDGEVVSVRGLVERVELEGGCTVLRADTGATYQLMGGDPNVVKPGATVTIRGRLRGDVMTICQMGPVLEVVSAQPS